MYTLFVQNIDFTLLSPPWDSSYPQDVTTEQSLISHHRRFMEIDLLRSLAIVLMVIYHGAYDLSAFAGWSIDIQQGSWLILERITANLFLLIVGISAVLAHQRMEERVTKVTDSSRFFLKRGLIVFGCGMLVSIATYPFLGSEWIRFGILHLIGVSLILIPLFLPLKEWNVLLAGIVFALGQWTNAMSTASPFLLLFGFRTPYFASADYFPLFPWLSAILLGIAIGNLLYRRGMLQRHIPETRLTRIFAKPGRHSLLIYLVHQPILMVIMHVALGKP